MSIFFSLKFENNRTTKKKKKKSEVQIFSQHYQPMLFPYRERSRVTFVQNQWKIYIFPYFSQVPNFEK
jgi:hypothetical protein